MRIVLGFTNMSKSKRRQKATAAIPKASATDKRQLLNTFKMALDKAGLKYKMMAGFVVVTQPNGKVQSFTPSNGKGHLNTEMGFTYLTVDQVINALKRNKTLVDR